MRTRADRRKLRAHHIKRKKRITSHWGIGPYYRHDGRFSKNKIHCSCALCKEKALLGKHPLTRSERIANMKLREETKELD